MNKVQGLSIDNEGLYLSKQLFAHGQTYVSFTRTTNAKKFKVMITDGKALDGE